MGRGRDVGIKGEAELEKKKKEEPSFICDCILY